MNKLVTFQPFQPPNNFILLKTTKGKTEKLKTCSLLSMMFIVCCFLESLVYVGSIILIEISHGLCKLVTFHFVKK